MGRLKVLNDTMVIMSEPRNNLGLFGAIQSFQRSPITQTIKPWQGLFFATFLHQGGCSSSIYVEVWVLHFFEDKYKCKLVNFIHIFWEGHKILQHLHLTFDWHYVGQK